MGYTRAKVKSNIFLEFLRRYVTKFAPQILKNNIENYINKKHAKSNLSYLKNANFFIGWSGSSLECLIDVKNKSDMITVLEEEVVTIPFK